MAFLDKIKDFFKRLKEENQGFAKTMSRINDTQTFYGAVNRGVKEGDFWNGSYVSVEAGHGVIYGSNQVDYTFEKADVVSLSVGGSANVSLGDKTLPGIQMVLTFQDGKVAQADILASKAELFRATFEPAEKE